MLLSHVEQNFIDAGNFFTQHDFDLSKIIAVGSAPLWLQRLKTRSPIPPPNDMDFLVLNEDIFAALAARGRTEAHTLNGYQGETVFLKPKNLSLPLDLTREWPVHNLTPKTIMAESIDIGSGIRIMSAQHARASMEQFQRLKDQARLAALDAHDFELKL